jgi:hypothetical protein
MSLRPITREDHPYRIHAAGRLDQVIRDSGVKAGWLALMLGCSEAALSQYRSGERPVPVDLFPRVDEILGGHDLMHDLAAMAGGELTFGGGPNLSSGGLEALIARHSGELLAALIQAREDGALSAEERQAIHPQVVRLIHELQGLAETIQPVPLKRRA